MPSRIVLADDHPYVLEETQALLEPEFKVVAAARDGVVLLRAVLESAPDLVITDVRMPGRNGIDAGREIVARGLCDAVVVLSLHRDPGFIESALAAGIRGYVVKDDAAEELVPAVRAVLKGERYLSSGTRSRITPSTTSCSLSSSRGFVR